MQSDHHANRVCEPSLAGELNDDRVRFGESHVGLGCKGHQPGWERREDSCRIDTIRSTGGS